MAIFGVGFGMGQYFHEKGLSIPGLAMTSTKPNLTNVRVVEFTHPNASHQWGIFLYAEREIDAVEMKTPTRAALYFK